MPPTADTAAIRTPVKGGHRTRTRSRSTHFDHDQLQVKSAHTRVHHGNRARTTNGAALTASDWRPSQAGTSPKAAVPAANREQTRAIRDWARQNGHELCDRGRIPPTVIKAFEAAHAGGKDKKK
ncbi:hypothetical protein DMH04_34420 [Kibdelosporangium aridum]|uniref:Lsr2 DNA-binding domain-containing protein n=1 Tax=Kibdelosporangium aridum TaxID=2030 RepID=A0A428Z0Q7_KIBAR|nr:histone-like nucleoid-structuring protein Lsr2 [Kibdelosporangium aridum]RSM77814.1 hypothetical protein DMH04_34420 [Kibdelosporangium aridum]